MSVYQDMAIDAGYTGEEAEQVAQMLEWEEQVAYERWAQEQQEAERYYASLEPHCTCDICREGGECPDREVF